MRELTAEQLNAGRTLLELAIKMHDPALIAALIPPDKNQPQSPEKNNLQSTYKKWFINTVLSVALQSYVEDITSSSVSAPTPNANYDVFINDYLNPSIDWVITENEQTLKNAALNAKAQDQSIFIQDYRKAVLDELRKRNLKSLLNAENKLNEVQILKEQYAKASEVFFKQLPATIETVILPGEHPVFVSFIQTLRNMKTLPKEFEQSPNEDILHIAQQTPWQKEDNYCLFTIALRECKAPHLADAKKVVNTLLNQVKGLAVRRAMTAGQAIPLRIAAEITIENFKVDYDARQFTADLDVAEWLHQYISLGRSEESSTAVIHIQIEQPEDNKLIILNFNDPQTYGETNTNGTALSKTLGAKDATCIQDSVTDIRGHLEPTWIRKLGNMLTFGAVELNQKKYDDRVLFNQAEKQIKRLCLIAEDVTLYNEACFSAWKVIKPGANSGALIIQDERMAPATEPLMRAAAKNPALWSSTGVPAKNNELDMIAARRAARTTQPLPAEKTPLLDKNDAVAAPYSAVAVAVNNPPAPAERGFWSRLFS